MKRKIIATILAIVMLIGVMPLASVAADLNGDGKITGVDSNLLKRKLLS